MQVDVVIIGGGPAGLSAALALGRARKRVLLCDNGPRRNAAAVQVHNFVTRDGTPPDTFREIAREQLSHYPSVELRDLQVERIEGARGAFQVFAGGQRIAARRILLATGMIDARLPIEGFDAHWGHSVFQCPYCHGWEVQDRRWGYLALPNAVGHLLPFTLQMKGWTQDVTLFTHGVVPLAPEIEGQLRSAGIRIETAPIRRLISGSDGLAAVELEGGGQVPLEALLVHPPQAQVALVQSLGLEVDEEGFVKVDGKRETSVPGIFAAGDLTTRMQAAIAAAAAGTQAASAINLEVTLEHVAAGTGRP